MGNGSVGVWGFAVVLVSVAMVHGPCAVGGTADIARLQRRIVGASSQRVAVEDGDMRTAGDVDVPFPDKTMACGEEIVENDEIRREIREELLDDVEKKWALQQAGVEDLPGNGESGVSTDGGSIFEALDGIVVPSVRFINAPLSSVVETLANIAEREGKRDGGINMVLLGTADGTAEPTVTLTLKNVTLRRVVEFVAQAVSYQFDVLGDAVVFYGRDMASNLMETEFFPLSRAALTKITGMQGINHRTAKAGEYEESIADEEREILGFLQRAGVDFKNVPGSSLAFDGSRAIVTHTRKNLARIARILEKYYDAKQVEIEAKFLEVQQGVLEELGFRWEVQSRANGANKFFQTGATEDGKSRDNLRTLAEAFASTNFSRGDGKIVDGTTTIPIANGAPGIPGQLNLGAGSIPLVNFTGVLNNIQFAPLLRALEQHSGSDLMSAPKLTVLSGKTAEIVIALEMRYPQRYGDTRSEVGVGTSTSGTASSAGVTITAGTPQDFATRNVGVEMRVTPMVEADGSISLQLEPKVTEFEGFVEYGGMSVGVSAGKTVTVPSGFYQPIFSTREIRTEVNIADGATVVMGGLTREEVKEVHDSVPILGKLPIFGFLFRSTSETTQKRNLLIFVTARTIPSGGKPSRPGISNGRENGQRGLDRTDDGLRTDNGPRTNDSHWTAGELQPPPRRHGRRIRNPRRETKNSDDRRMP